MCKYGELIREKYLHNYKPNIILSFISILKYQRNCNLRIFTVFLKMVSFKINFLGSSVSKCICTFLQLRTINGGIRISPHYLCIFFAVTYLKKTPLNLFSLSEEVYTPALKISKLYE